MAAGVPIKAQVAGIAMGLVKKDEHYTILTDIQGMEDHLGDMDFKVAGTSEGITALQMDIKIDGLSEQILKESLEQARVGRLQILEHMNSVIAEPRKEVSTFAPKIKIIKIKPEKIKDVIGSGGKVINEIIEKTGVKIDIEQNGDVFISSPEIEGINKAIEIIENITREAEVGEIYLAEVKRIEKFGAFVELFPGVDALVHISKLAEERVNRVEDVVKVGDTLKVKVIKIDEKGRVDLNKLEKYGNFISYSKRGRYACIYVDENRIDSIVADLKKKKFVKKIELSGMSDLHLSFEHLDSSLLTKQ